MIFNRKFGVATMNLQRLFGPALLAAWLVIGGLPESSSAQNQPAQAVRTLVIKDNQILIDGRQIDTSDLPKSLQLDSMSVSYSFIGIDEPVVHLRNHFFAVRPNRLELIPGEYEISGRRLKDGKMDHRDMNAAQGWIVDADKGQYYSFQGERLEVNEAVPKLLNEANTLYLDGLQYHNQPLFSRLSRETELESEAARLAGQVRAAKTETDRKAKTGLLVAKLNEIFEFKQDNRRAEIAQFERELERLRERVERREAQKQLLINRRLELLTEGEHRNQP
ncbi:MAG TPA: hypothetical protein VIL33_04515 [Rhodothermia bacterium]